MLNTLFIGCGAVLEQLYKRPLQELQSDRLLRIVGVVDPSEPRRMSACRWFGKCMPFSDLDGALSHLQKVDLTIIASPPVYHSAQAVRAMQRGSHVLCEKPMAHSVSDAEDMVAFAKEQRVTLAIGMVRRYYPAISAAKLLLREIGVRERLQFHYREGSTFDWPIASAAFFSRDSSGGILMDRGIHALDTLYFLLGSPATLLRSADDALAGKTVEANARLELSFGENRGTVQLSWETQLNNGLQLSGSDGDLWLPIFPIMSLWRRTGKQGASWQQIRADKSWPNSLQERTGKTMVPLTHHDCIKLQLVSVLRSIILGEPPTVGPEEGLDVLRLLLAAYDQAGPLQKPWLSKEENAEMAASHGRSDEREENISCNH